MPRPCVGCACGKLAEKCELTLSYHTPSVIAVSAEDTADAAVVGRNWAIRKGVIRFLRVSISLHDQELRFYECPLVASHSSCQHRADVGPDFVPHLVRWAPRRPRMFSSNDGFVLIVVKINQLLAPANPNWLA